MKQTLILFLLLALLPLTAQDLYEALISRDTEKVMSIIGTDSKQINLKDKEGDIPLCTAIMTRQTELSLFMIGKGADVNNQNLTGYTPLHWAAMRGDSTVALALMDHGADMGITNSQGQTALHIASERGQQAVVKLLLMKSAMLEQEDIRNRTPLHGAVRERGGLGTVKILVEAGANINAVDRFGDTPLSLGAWRGFEDIVNYLLDKNVILNASGKEGITLLKYATDKRLLRLYSEVMLKGGPRFEKEIRDLPVLHWAASGGNLAIVEDLIRRGFTVDGRDYFAWTPLHYAAYFGRLEVTKLLYEKGADINSRTKLGESAFYLATSENRTEIIEYLISLQADQTITSITNYKGPYWGQVKPGKRPELFAPGIVSRLKGGHSNISFSPGGEKAVWTEWNLTDVGYTDGCTVWYAETDKGTWKMPEIFLKMGDTPIFSPDGRKIYLMATFRDDNDQEKHGIWYYETGKDKLSGPFYLDFDVRSMGLYWQFSFDSNENIYFSTDEGMFRSLKENGKYSVKEKLTDIFHPEYKGSQPFISPEGDYLIFSSMDLPDCYGSLDLYIGFRKADGSWTAPINLGPEINSPEMESLPIITPDDRYLFYRTQRNGISGVYWLSADKIFELRIKI